MIGAAIDADISETPNPYYVFHVERGSDDSSEWYRLRNYKGTAYHSTPNVSGPRQTAVHDFCEAEPVDMVEPPQQPAERQPAHNLPTRGEDTLFLTWWMLMSDESPIADILRDMTAELQHQDRLDLRQDVALKTWQRALTAELAGRKARINGQAVRRLVEQWLTRNGKALRPADAQASPEDAAKARELIEQERDAKRQEEWKREVMRLRAMNSQKAPPAPVLLFTW